MRESTAGILIGMFSIFSGMNLCAQNQVPSYSLHDRFISSAGLCGSWIPSEPRSGPFYGVCYSPSLNIINKFSDFSFAAASQLSFSWHPANATDSSSYSAFSIPLYARFNFGHLATRNFYSTTGIFVGAGYQFNVINSDLDRGALLITAIRFWISKLSITAGYAWSKLNGQHEIYHQVSLQLNLGAYLSDTRKNNKISKFVRPFRK